MNSRDPALVVEVDAEDLRRLDGREVHGRRRRPPRARRRPRARRPVARRAPGTRRAGPVAARSMPPSPADATGETPALRSAPVVTPELLSLEQKIELLAGADIWHTAAFDDPACPPSACRTGRPACAARRGPGPASASFPCGAALGATFDPDLVRRRRPGPRARGPLEERPRPARPDRQPPPHADRRAQLRVHERGPGAHRRARRGVRRGRPGRGRGGVHQALRRQRHRVRADDDLQRDRRAHAPRALPRSRSRPP